MKKAPDCSYVKLCIQGGGGGGGGVGGGGDEGEKKEGNEN